MTRFGRPTKRRFSQVVALVLVAVLTLLVLPVSVFASETASTRIRYGTYDDEGNWTAISGSTTSYTSQNGTDLTLSKATIPTGNENEYEIVMTVQAQTYEITEGENTTDADAATVLIIDTSISMEGKGIADAKQVASQFVDSYKTSNSKRYLAIVSFNTFAYRELDWVDVSTENGYNSAISAITSLYADGTTFLGDGLDEALELLNSAAITSISQDMQFAIALTDGATFDEDRFPEVADDVKADVNKLYTVFTPPGYSSYYSYSEFLRDEVASPGCAYTTSDTLSLSDAFADITSDIIRILGSIPTGVTVTDPMAESVSVVSTSSSQFTTNDNTIYTWRLETPVPVVVTEGNTTTKTYTFTSSYTVLLDVDSEEYKSTDKHPFNGKTTLNWNASEQFQFPVPLLDGSTAYEPEEPIDVGDQNAVWIPRKSAVTLTLTDKDNGRPLPGATYELYRTGADGAESKYGYTEVTNSYGKIVVAVTPGNYYWIEKTAADGYTVDTAKHEFSVGYGVQFIAVDVENSKITETKPVSETADVPAVEVKENVETTPALPFVDVRSDAPFYEDVKYVYDNGIMNGVSATEFAPDSTLTRAMVVTILYRSEGEPEIAFKEAPPRRNLYEQTFTDVEIDLWYSEAVEWAAANGIVNGYGDGKFGPADPVTREQLAAILYRYANYVGNEIHSSELNAADTDDVSAYAVEPVKWAVANDILNAYADGTILPTRVALRSEVATAIHAFNANVAK